MRLTGHAVNGLSHLGAVLVAATAAAAGPVHGVVVDLHGAPIAGAMVVAGGDGLRASISRSATTDAAGRFEIAETLDAPVFATAPGHAVGWASAEDGEVTITLRETQPVTVLRVERPGGRPAVSAPLAFATAEGVVIPYRLLAHALHAEGYEAQADEDGLVCIDLLPPGEYEVLLASGREPPSLGLVVLPADRPLTVTLPDRPAR